MSTLKSVVVDSLVYMHADGTYSFQPRIYRDGSALDLTGKTVTATIRAKRAPQQILHSSFEDMSVTVGNADHTAVQGGTALTVTPSSTYFYTPASAGAWEDYYVQYHVMPDDFYPARLLIHITRNLD